jgi:hypothetical protein
MAHGGIGTIEETLQRVQGEFREMPGLRLTPAQASRLWGLDAVASQAVLDALVDVRFLRKTADGAFICAQPTPSGRFITQGLRSVEDAPGVSRALRAGSAFGLAAAAAALACAVVVSATTLQVPAGGDLQSALFNAQPGDTIVLTPGATYTGNFTLPDKGGSSLITLQTDPQGLPVPASAFLPPRRPGSRSCARQSGSRRFKRRPVRITGGLSSSKFQANAGGAGDIVALGSGSARRARSSASRTT